MISLQAARRECAWLREQFEGSTCCFETCGWVRRRVREGESLIHHVVVPVRSAEGLAYPVLERAFNLVRAGKIEDGAGFDEPDVWQFVLRHNGYQHAMIVTRPDALGPTLAKFTGPDVFWSVLVKRLMAAGTLMLHHRQVSVIDRSGVSERLIPLPCGNERTFFKLARYRWRDPWHRFNYPPGLSATELMAGLEPEWYPPGTRVFASPKVQPHLFHPLHQRPQHGAKECSNGPF